MDIRALKNNPWLRRARYGVAGVLIAWALAWLVVPPVLKHQAQKVASERLGRTVTIGSVDFNPWSLELTLSDLVIATADGKADQLRMKRLHVDAELESVLRWAPVVDAVVVDAPALRLTHLGGGRYDIDDVLQRLQKSAGEVIFIDDQEENTDAATKAGLNAIHYISNEDLFKILKEKFNIPA
jgi:hypothetical protein